MHAPASAGPRSLWLRCRYSVPPASRRPNLASARRRVAEVAEGDLDVPRHADFTARLVVAVEGHFRDGADQQSVLAERLEWRLHLSPGCGPA